MESQPSMNSRINIQRNYLPAQRSVPPKCGSHDKPGAHGHVLQSPTHGAEIVNYNHIFHEIPSSYT